MSGPDDPGDPDGPAEEDLWFLPGPVEEEAVTLPWPTADRRPLADPGLWREAEAGLAQDLAAAAVAFARLDERLRLEAELSPTDLREGLLRRLAFQEASALTWGSGAGRTPPDRLALYDVLRVSMAVDANRDLAKAHWAFRRLVGGPGPEEDLPAFLDRRAQEEAPGSGAIVQRPVGAAFAAASADWQAHLEAAGDLHPLTRAAFALSLWRMFELSAPGEALEGLVVAARLAASDARALRFVPTALGGGLVHRIGGGPVEDRLAAWYQAVTQAAGAARGLLDGLAHWRRRAAEVTADLSGRTPPLLIAGLAAHAALSTEMAATVTGASRAAAQRNLDRFAERGLVREITGHSRFRFWTAAV